MRAGLGRPLAPCSHPGCPNLVAGGGRCPEHQGQDRAPWRTSTRRTTERGYGWRWQQRRARALRRDGHRCTVCGAPAREVDHLVPISRGGSDDLENLRTLCPAHHREKTQRDSQAVRSDGPVRHDARESWSAETSQVSGRSVRRYRTASLET